MVGPAIFFGIIRDVGIVEKVPMSLFNADKTLEQKQKASIDRRKSRRITQNQYFKRLTLHSLAASGIAGYYNCHL